MCDRGFNVRAEGIELPIFADNLSYESSFAEASGDCQREAVHFVITESDSELRPAHGKAPHLKYALSPRPHHELPTMLPVRGARIIGSLPECGSWAYSNK